MKAKFIIFASLLLCACSNEERQSVSYDDLKAETPKLATIKHYSLPLEEFPSAENSVKADQSGMNISYHEHASDENVSGTSQRGYTISEISGIEDLTSKAESVHMEIVDVWDETFTPMYDDYVTNGTDVEVVAENIEQLHKTYNDLEIEVQNLNTPDFLSPAHVNTLNALKSDLELAISNRSLALIEFKLMNEKDNDIMHEELLDVHVGNSYKYLSSADQHMEKLFELEDDTASSQQNKLASSDE